MMIYSLIVEEILNFGQADLVTEDVMLLDVGDCIFVWLGKDSNEVEKKACVVSAKEYLASDPTDRDKDIPIMVVKQSFEPPSFTGFFGIWDDELFGVSRQLTYSIRQAQTCFMALIGLLAFRTRHLPSLLDSSA